MVSSITGICSDCKMACNAISVDMGIGPYEYWGQQCNDVRLCLASDCCEAPVTDENGVELLLEDYLDEQM